MKQDCNPQNALNGATDNNNYNGTVADSAPVTNPKSAIKNQKSDSQIGLPINPNQKSKIKNQKSELPASNRFGVAQGVPAQTLNLERGTLNSSESPSDPLLHHSITPPLRYSLRKGLGFWQLTFRGQDAVLKHEQGLNYVAYLLLNPPAEPIHGLALAMQTKAACVTSPGIAEITDPLSGETVVVPSEAVFQQRGLGLDDAEAAQSLRREIQKLEAIVDNEDTSEPVREEVLRELKGIYAHEKKSLPRVRNSSQKAVRAVRIAIKRFHEHLIIAASASQGPSAWALRAFAQHIESCLIIPSARFSTPGAIRARKELVGCFTYEPPQGVIWSS